MTISIITATWNSASTVRDTFDSVLRQSYQDYEYIVVDGGSTDGTVDIIREYEPLFGGRMHWMSEPDEGIYDAMNKGIARATGDVVGILNSDDFFTSFSVLNTIANRFGKYPDIDAVYGDIHYVQRDDITRMVRYYSGRNFRRWWMRMGFMPAHPSFYCRKAVYEKFRLDARNIDGFKGDTEHAYFDTTYSIAADFECLLRMIFVGRIRIHYIWMDFVTMRYGGASSSGTVSHKQINRDHLRAFRENGVYSNYMLISLRYCYKLVELALGRIRR